MNVVTRVRTLVFCSAILFGQTDPSQEMWKRLKTHLTDPGGEEYFNTHVKDVLVPTLKGTLTSSLLNEGVSKLVLGMSDGNTPEATLIVHHLGWVAKKPIKTGTIIEFTGVAKSYTRDPFMLTFDVGMRNIKGIEFERSQSKND